MGVMARVQDEVYVITSDRISGDSPSKTAPKRQLDRVFQTWTGEKWSSVASDAITFEAIEDADDYIKDNSARLMANG